MHVAPAKKVLLKDQLFNRVKVEKLAREVEHVYPSFKRSAFVLEVMAGFPERELKERISWMAVCLKKYLPNEYKKAVSVMLKALPEPCDPTLSDNDFGDFIYAPYADFVAQHGCTKAHLDFSLRALREMTTRFSAEDAIRYFINAFPEETLKVLLAWSKDGHYHIRRLASEGTRPKLPWARKVTIPIIAPLPILDNLFQDNTRFVTRSVANHLNDIAKIDPDLCVDTLLRWQKSGKQQPAEMDYLVRHGLRTLIKQGNPRAMQLLGFSHAPQVRVSDFVVPTEVKMESALAFSFDVKAQEDANMVIDYILCFQNKTGQLNSKKVFKLKTVSLGKGEKITLSKQHPLRQFMTTRTLYAGLHSIALQINGRVFAEKSFLLTE